MRAAIYLVEGRKLECRCCMHETLVEVETIIGPKSDLWCVVAYSSIGALLTRDIAAAS